MLCCVFVQDVSMSGRIVIGGCLCVCKRKVCLICFKCVSFESIFMCAVEYVYLKRPRLVVEWSAGSIY